MKRWRLAGAAGGLAGVAAALATFLVPVPGRGLLLLVDESGGVRARTGPGLALRVPWTTRTVRLAPASGRLEATWRLRPAGGGGRPVRIELTAGSDPGGIPEQLLEQARGLQDYLDRHREAIRRRVEATLAASPAREADLPRRVRRELASALASWSLRPAEVQVELLPGRTLPATRDTGVRLLLVGIDAADWDRIEPLLEDGRLPNLARLRRGGSWGVLRSDRPLLSPLLWTTAATGKPPDVHGVVDFVMIDPSSGAPIPISSHFRRVKAFWNILSDAGLSVDVVGWWATWPAEPVEGVMVTDRVAYSLFEYDRRADEMGATFPPSYLATAAGLRLEASDVAWEQVRALAAVSRSEFERSTAELADATEQTFHDSLNNLRRTLAATFTYHRIALDLLGRAPPRLMAVYYQGLDEVNHRFAHLAGEVLPLGDAAEAQRFGGTIDAFYELQDRLLGQLLEAAPADTTVMVVSDHGFANGSERPRGFLPFIEAGVPGRWHTLEGIFLLHGPPVEPGRLTRPVRLAQITPTLLRLLGLPLAEDMERAPVEEAIRPAFLGEVPELRIPTYEEGEGARQDPVPAAPSVADDEMLARLRSLGYLAPSGAGEGHGPGAAGITSANYHANLGSILLERGDYEAAAAEFRRALEIHPAQVSARGGLVHLDIVAGEDDRALEGILSMLEETAGYDPVFYYMAAQLFRRTGRVEEGLERFEALVREHPEIAQIRTGLGVLLQADGDVRGAAAAYRAALDRQPDALFALQELYSLQMEADEPADLLPRLEAAMAAAPRKILPYNWAGLALRRMGRAQQAEARFRRALELSPDSVRTLVNLSSLLVDGGRSDEAIPLLERARRLQPDAAEPRVNLIVALGRVGRLEEAVREFQEGGGVGSGSTALLNAMAFAYYLNGASAEARELLERSLVLGPDQEQARRLLDRLGTG